MSQSDPARAPTSPIAAVVPAAGLSSRMGRFKPLLPFGGLPMVVCVAESLSAAGVSPVLVVTGHRRNEVAAAVESFGGGDVWLVHNPDFERGEMLSSVRAGVGELPPGAAAFVLALADQPAVEPETIQLLCDTWRRTGAPIVRPCHDGRHGHPILFSSECIPEILALTPGETLKSLVRRRADAIVDVPVADPAVVADVDTPEDYQQVLKLWERRFRVARRQTPSRVPVQTPLRTSL